MVKRGELKEKNSVTVKFEHLHPRVQELIKSADTTGSREYFKNISRMLNGKPMTPSIRMHRINRSIADYGLVVNSLASVSTMLMAPSIAVGAAARSLVANSVQKKHEELKEYMNKFGILQTQHEHNYPFSWFNPTIVAKTHPVFYVKGNGDVVFRRSTRTEYLRYLAQKKKLVSGLGLNPWRWRAYLAPPTAPEKVKVWAKAKLRALVPARPAALVPIGVRRERKND